MIKAAASQPLVAPNGVIGILGGGQLARMLAQATARLGMQAHILAPEADAPAFSVARFHTHADYEDEAALRSFADVVDAVTYEFENVPVRTVEILGECAVEVAPGAGALAIAQDRLHEKQFLNDIGAATAPFHAVDDLESLTAGLRHVGRPSILKTRRLGYDGKGQTLIDALPEGAGPPGALEPIWRSATEKAWAEIGARPAILEGFIDFECEISVIGARARDGDVKLYDPPRNHHHGGILRISTAPSGVDPRTIEKAFEITRKILSELDYVGIIGVEFFVLKNGDIVVNEFAPRVHNSGHWTEAACAVSQFEQHIRAVAGWPLGDPERHSDAVMENLIGDEAARWLTLSAHRAAILNLYGKRATKPGRKMGHITHLKPRR